MKKGILLLASCLFLSLIIAGSASATYYPNVPAGYSFYRNLGIGSSGDDVTYLNSILQAEGCSVYTYNYNSTSSYFDASTSQAVVCFQNKYRDQISAIAGYRIKATGYVGVGTRTELNSLVSPVNAYNYNNYPYNYNYNSNYNYNNGTLSASCYSLPSAVSYDQSTTFSASATGGNGIYTYSWSGACVGSGSTCYSGALNNNGINTAYLTVYSGGQSQTMNCTVNVGNYDSNYNSNYNYNYPYNNYYYNNPQLVASCYASLSSINAGQTVNFTGSATGGNGSYNYSWTGACVGTGSSCYSGALYNTGNNVAYLTVTSGSQTQTVNCPVTVNAYNNYAQYPYNYYGYNNYNNNYISCLASPTVAYVGQPVTFFPSVAGGTDNGYYTYSWSGACSGYNSSCTNVYSMPGSYTSYLTVVAGGITSTVNCTASVR